MLVGASPAVLALLILAFVPESERWKAAVKKGAEVRLSRFSSRGVLSKTVFAAILSGIPLIGTWAAVSAYIPTWVDDMKPDAGSTETLDRREPRKI